VIDTGNGWPIRPAFFALAMIFGAAANGCALFMLYRMRSIGHKIGIWRTGRDLALYREYWRIAPEKNWSRAPLTIGIISLILTGCFLFQSAAIH
jgi:hypothetical protein